MIAQGGATQGFDPTNLESIAPSPVAYGAISPGLESTDVIEQRIRKQYETRLKEAAAKIQQAYEQHLKEKLVEAKTLAQQDYDQRLAEAIERYQDQAEERIAQAVSNPALHLSTLNSGEELPTAGVMPDPGPGEHSDAIVQERLASLEARLQADYEQRLAARIEHYQDELMQRTQALEADFGARLQMLQGPQPGATRSNEVGSNEVGSGPDPGIASRASEAELRQQIEASLKAEYEQKLAEKIEHYQDELTKRTEEIEQGMASRLQLLQPPTPAPSDVSLTPNRASAPGSSSAPAPGSRGADNAPASAPKSPPESPPESALDSTPDNAPDLDLDELLTGSSTGARLGIAAAQAPAAETAPALPPLETPAASGNNLPLPDEDLFALDTDAENTENIEADLNINTEGTEGLDWASNDSQEFNLDNLDALLKQSNLDDELSDDLFDSLDDLSNLS
ncbi:MAG: hypothetical protein HC922_08590 [Leptolyngbyaceae cyanobacterium SM2_3_12]|nr:hypothetical protein [Leptolyngbyaceae cyanobacterium SM2_3_12]